MNQFSSTVFATEVAAEPGALGHVIVVLLLAVALALTLRSLRLIWGPISEIVVLLVRAGAAALLILLILITMVAAMTLGVIWPHPTAPLPKSGGARSRHTDRGAFGAAGRGFGP